MNHVRIATVYTLLLVALGVGAGIIVGIVRRLVGLDHQWGSFDVTAALRLVVTVAVTLGVFAVLARRHPSRYYAIGSIVVLLTTIFGVASAYLLAPQSARGTYDWQIAVGAPLALNGASLVAVGLFRRVRKSSSNTSLERTREG
jgi:hypothetical protein